MRLFYVEFGCNDPDTRGFVHVLAETHEDAVSVVSRTYTDAKDACAFFAVDPFDADSVIPVAREGGHVLQGEILEFSNRFLLDRPSDRWGVS